MGILKENTLASGFSPHLWGKDGWGRGGEVWEEETTAEANEGDQLEGSSNNLSNTGWWQWRW